MSSRLGRLFIISGPSGSGKTTLAQKLVRIKQLKLQKSISFCTRKPRLGEKDKKDYFFINKKEFLEKKKIGEFIEWTKYLDTFYGTSKKYLDAALKNDKNIIFCLDMKGARILKKKYPKQTTTIFILPPSKKELEKRVKDRGNMVTRELRARMKLADKERKYAKNYDYTIINDDLIDTLKKISIIIRGKNNKEY
ncbi:MAG: guanylate kinase [Candidatus Omnitrophota bacterium]